MPTAANRYTEYTPCAALRPYVECFWSWLSASPAPDTSFHRVLPDGCMDIVFNFGESWAGSNPSGELANFDKSYVVGTMTRPLLVGLGNRAEFLGVRFRPGKAPAFLRLSADELTDRSASLDNLWGRTGKTLEARLAELPNLQRKITELERVLLRRLALDGKQDPRVEAAVDFILRQRGTPSVQAVCAHAGISRQHLARKFAHHVGISPKLFCRVVRFQNIVERLRGSGPVDWSATALELGYYDQAHMISDFKELAGLSPGQYRLSR